MHDLTNAALLLIGMQQGSNDLKLGNRNNPQAEDNMLRLLQAWRGAKRAVIHARHVSRLPASVFSPGQPGVEFQPDFAPLPDEHVIDKSAGDAFTNTGLEDWLRERDITQLVIVGVSTNNSVESTARSAGSLGFPVFVPGDATFTFDKPDLNGVHRPACEVHAMSLANLHGEYATVTSSEALLSKDM